MIKEALGVTGSSHSKPGENGLGVCCVFAQVEFTDGEICADFREGVLSWPTSGTPSNAV